MNQVNKKNKDIEAKYCDILLTDIQLHVKKPRKPTPWYRVIIGALKSGKKTFRVYSKKYSIDQKNKTIRVRFDSLTPEIQEEIIKAEKDGKIVRIWRPAEGLPVCNGPDATEKFKADERKLKGLDRKK